MSNYPKDEEKQQTEKQHTNEEVTEQSVEKNDDINWSELKNLSLGEVIEQLDQSIDASNGDLENSDDHEKKLTDASIEKLFEDNPILATYIRGHKDGTQVEALTKIEELMKQKEEDNQTKVEKAETPKQEESKSEQTTDSKAEFEQIAQEENEELFNSETIEEDSGKHLSIQSDEVSQDSNEPEKNASMPADVVEDETKARVEIEQNLPEEESALAQEDLQETQPSSDEIPEESQNEEDASALTEASEKVPPKDGTEGSKQESATETLVDPLPTREEKLTKKSAKRKWYAAAAILAVGVSGGVYYTHVQAVAQAEKQQKAKEQAQLASVTKKLNASYVNNQQQFLKATVTQSDLTALENQLNKMKQVPGYQSVQESLEKAQEKLTQIDALNEKFTTPILVDGEIQTNAHVKDVENAQFTTLSGTTEYAQTYNAAVAIAEKEIASAKSTVANANKLAESLSNGQLATTTSQKNYDDVKQQISSLYDTALQEKLQKQILPVQVALTKRATAAKVAQEAAAQAKAAQEKAAQEKATQAKAAQEAAQAKANQAAETQMTTDTLLKKIAANTNYSEKTQILNTTTATNKENRPIIDSRKSDLANSTSAAWNWGDGMYDFVINRCISKGYIVPNGFYLERVRIENGEGYYNLYAMNNESALMKGISSKALPMYIATINAKTGYFKGNGSN
ncbi:cell division site-positioning protein MapZ family protein [Enterococcus camelliae]|uniref:Cell division site-positioning protein MapZ family protein n=1 Tax=Enterococcus camelliae TaxID=453959 RepID=A0ABW5TLC5_9ENTE